MVKVVGRQPAVYLPLRRKLQREQVEVVRVNALEVVRKASLLTDSVVVGVSGGKDSVVTLDLCFKYFKKVEGYFLYFVEGLEFQERYLKYLERRYGIRFHRLPHWRLSAMYKDAIYRPHTMSAISVSNIKIKDIEFKVSRLTGIDWFATGQKTLDSIDRNAMLKRCDGIDEKAKRIYPLAVWNNANVFNYLKLKKIPLPPDYGMFSFNKNASYGEMSGRCLIAIRERYPDDYEKILNVFPFAEAAVKKYEFATDYEAPKV